MKCEVRVGNLKVSQTFLFQLQASSHIVKYFEIHIQQMNK